MNGQDIEIQKPEKGLYFRDAGRADLGVIVAIYNSIVASRMVTADIEPVTTESREQWFAEHDSGTHPLWVVENDEKEITGWVSLQRFHTRPAYAKTAEISIYLDARYRGQGMGGRILACSMEKAAGLGIDNLVGFIFAHNIPSLRLFERAGFEEWAHMPDVAELDGVKRSLKILGKKIV